MTTMDGCLIDYDPKKTPRALSIGRHIQTRKQTETPIMNLEGRPRSSPPQQRGGLPAEPKKPQPMGILALCNGPREPSTVQVVSNTPLNPEDQLPGVRTPVENNRFDPIGERA